MWAVPTTTITIRSESGNQDPYAPDYEQDQDNQTGVPCSLLEQNSNVTPDGVPIPRDISYAVGRVDANVAVSSGDTVIDERTTTSWMVEEVAYNHNPIIQPDKRLALKRVS